MKKGRRMSADRSKETLEEIWDGDLFGRQREAELLSAYIESVWQRPATRDDFRAYTISVDAPYGEGKSYFLRKFARHLRRNHPVAFVDAWADDLADEPLTALSATLRTALKPFIAASPNVRSKWDKAASQLGTVAKIVGKGLIKRTIDVALTAGTATALSGALEGTSEKVSDAVREDMQSLGKEIVDGAERVFDRIAPGRLMEERIASFEEGRETIKALKLSLKSLVASLNGHTQHPPIIIVIDELDRCRPTYAVKLLEEIKHLFDVPGIVFIFGLNGPQLAGSLSGAYGPNFDGASYLRRFISRQYSLETPSVAPLVRSLMDAAGLSKSKFETMKIGSQQSNGTYRETPLDLAGIIAKYMKAYDLTARDAFLVVDQLQMCAALTKDDPLELGLLLPIILNKISGESPEAHNGVTPEKLRRSGDTRDWALIPDKAGDSIRDFTLIANAMHVAAHTPIDELRRRCSTDGATESEYRMIVLRDHKGIDNLSNPLNYRQLVETVGRFSSINPPN